MGLTRENIFPCLFNFLFSIRTNDKQVKLYKRWADRRSHPSVTIGVQIRHNGEGDEHLKCTESLASYYTSHGLATNVLLICRNHGMREKFANHFPGRIYLPPQDSRSDTNLEDFDTDSTDGKCKRKKHIMVDGLTLAFRDIHLLSLTDVQIVSHSSGFGVVGSLLRVRNKTSIFRAPFEYSQCSDHLDGTPLKVFAGDWSNL